MDATARALQGDEGMRWNKTKTMWKRVYPTIIGKRFFDGGEYGLGYFTVVKAYRCKEYCKGALSQNGTHWFDKAMILVKTDTGLKYKIPFCPWVRVTSAETGKWWSEDFNKNPW